MDFGGQHGIATAVDSFAGDNPDLVQLPRCTKKLQEDTLNF